MSKAFPLEFELHIKKMNTAGEGVGHYNGRKVSVFGVAPGDHIIATPLKVSRHKSKARLVKVCTPAKNRLTPKDEHYPSSSPWQVLPYDMQLELKQKSVQSFFGEKAQMCFLEMPIQESLRTSAYRNKMEYGFTLNPDGEISPGLKLRYRWRDMYPITDARIVPARMNEVTQHITQALRDSNCEIEDLKSLVIRYSFKEGICIAGLFVTRADFPDIHITHPQLKGFHIVYSDPISPASNISKELYSYGQTLLTEEISGKIVQFHWNGFFQQNIKTFNTLIECIRTHITSTQRLVDLYSGVGTLGISLADLFHEVLAIEYNNDAAEIAVDNARNNNVNTYNSLSGEVEHHKIDSIITKDDTVVVDPPRSGLHKNAIRMLLSAAPQSIVYVSCNPKTQAIDIQKLKEKYIITHIQLFDIYPQTPHVESVVFLQAR